MRLTGFILALSTLLVADLPGQAPLDSAVKSLKSGETIRIRVHGGERIESRVVAMQTEPLGLKLSGATAAVDAAAIDSLWVRGRATRVGTNTGAILGGLLSFGFGAAVCTGVAYGAGCNAWGTVAAVGVGGAIGGALVGALIGSRVGRWHLRYTRR